MMNHPSMPNLMVNYPHKICILTSKYKRLMFSKFEFYSTLPEELSMISNPPVTFIRDATGLL